MQGSKVFLHAVWKIQPYFQPMYILTLYSNIHCTIFYPHLSCLSTAVPPQKLLSGLERSQVHKDWEQSKGKIINYHDMMTKADGMTET